MTTDHEMRAHALALFEENTALRATIKAAGGTVEGKPTQAHDILQRIRVEQTNERVNEGSDPVSEDTMSAMSAMSSRPILCVDFDGVIHSYTSGWKGAAVIPDPPVPGALEWLYDATKYFEVVIYSSRSKDPEAIHAMRMWLTFHARSQLPALPAEVLLAAVRFAQGDEGKPSAFLTLDDRAVCFDGDWERLDPEELLKFKPWYQRSAKTITEEITDDLAVTQASTQKSAAPGSLVG